MPHFKLTIHTNTYTLTPHATISWPLPNKRCDQALGILNIDDVGRQKSADTHLTILEIDI